MTTEAEAFLAHHGVLGMHWGKRNIKPGVTKAPRAPKAKVTPHHDHTEAANLRSKKVSELSTAELRKLNDRTQTEKTYSQLNPGRMAKGKKIALGIVGTAGVGITVYNQVNSKAGRAALRVGKKYLDKIGVKAAETIMQTIL